MAILPIKKCNKCDHIFESANFGPKVTCPRCSSKLISEATKADIAFKKKMDAKGKN